MSRRKRLALVLTATSAMLSAAVVLGVDQPEADAQQTFEMKCATVAPADTPWENQLRELGDYIESESGGRIDVRMFMGGSLGGEKALVRRTAQGSIQCFGGSTAALGSLVPELNVIESPFLFDNVRQADRKLDGPALPIVEQSVEARGFEFGLWAENGFRSWFTKDSPVLTPDDMQGRRMRSQEALVHLETYRAVGASPVPIDVTNVLTSLQTGVVEGFDNTPIFAFAASWYQAADHLTLSRHSYQPGIVVWSKSWYDSLPSDLQQILDDIPAEHTTNGRRMVRQMDPILIRNLERRDIEVHELTDAQRAAFEQATSDVASRVATKAGGRGRRLLRALQ